MPNDISYTDPTTRNQIHLLWQANHEDEGSEWLDLVVSIDHNSPPLASPDLMKKASRYDGLVIEATARKDAFARTLDDKDLANRLILCEQIYVTIQAGYDGSTVIFRNV